MNLAPHRSVNIEWRSAVLELEFCLAKMTFCSGQSPSDMARSAHL
jgi:hypothetical protein